MPEPPSTSFLDTYIFESPLTMVGVFLLVGVVILLIGLRDGRRPAVITGLIIAGLGGLTAVIGMQVTTAGEHASEVTRAFVEAAADNDVRTAMLSVSDDATLNAGRVENPGVDVDAIRGQLNILAAFGVESNRIRSIDGFSIDGDVGEVHLACTTSGGGIPCASEWVVRVRRESDDVWRIDRITNISLKVGGRDVNHRFR